MDIVQKIKEIECKEGELLISWIGQAGFVIKNSKNKILAIDVYLSDLAMRKDGNKRLTPSILKAQELKTDVILVTHSHTDHLDLDSLPVMIEEDTNLYCSTESFKLCVKNGFPKEKLHEVEEGDTFEDSGYQIKATFADHGDTSPDAVGFLICSDNINVYFTGDTSYQQERLINSSGEKVDILLVPINGEYGNMNENDAAMLADQLKAVLTIPCHFWTFARHEGSPYKFQTAMKVLAPECEGYVMAQGEIIRYAGCGYWESV